MFLKRSWKALRTAGVLVLAGAACDVFGGAGVCVSDAVEYTFGLRVYCYNDWTSDECAEWDDQQVNGASWFFHAGQTCEDRDLVEGSNPWP